MEPSTLDALDRRIIHCLQLSPRAPWSSLAPILGVDPVTLSRRWQQLTGEGVVYVTPIDSRVDELVFAFLEISCPPSGVAGVVEVLCKEPAVLTVDRVAGGRDLMAIVIAENVDALTAWSSATIAPLTQVRSLRTLPVAELVADARAWRIRALKPREAAAVDALLTDGLQAPPRLDPAERAALVTALADDFRAPASQLADTLGLPTRRVRDALRWLLATGELSVRIDVARPCTDWPIYVWYFLTTPASQLDRVTAQLSRLPEMRTVAKTVGSYNVVLATWMRTLQDAQRLEAVIEENLPDVRIGDRAVVLRTHKHVSHPLDERGLCAGAAIPFIPVGA